jgi:hypothetical protein
LCCRLNTGGDTPDKPARKALAACAAEFHVALDRLLGGTTGGQRALAAFEGRLAEELERLAAELPKGDR